ncbi:MAG: hypothetical protein VB122_08100 [Erysipelotrichales bacterium]|nr:hypothetical protein [Erysipelotrichales bacterium]
MHNYVYVEDTISKNFNIIFLCGVKHNTSVNDKRNVLKDYLINLDARNCALILEEHFIFGKSNKKKLSYDDIYMHNLNSVEMLTALFSDLVFIIHESNSTAAEFGMFATNELLRGKLCLLIPDEISVEENKISAFLKYAFFRKSNDIERIVFYPSTEVWRLSNNKSDFRTQFADNKIGYNLSENINNFINKQIVINPCIKIKQAPFNRYLNDIDTISYIYNKEKQYVNIRISPEMLKWQIISLFNIDSFKSEIRKNKKINEHVTFVKEFYENIMINTLEHKDGITIDKINVFIKGTNISTRNVIAYLLYLLQAMGKIYFIQEEDDPYIRKIRIENDFKELYEKYSVFVKPRSESIYGGINI